MVTKTASQPVLSKEKMKTRRKDSRDLKREGELASSWEWGDEEAMGLFHVSTCRPELV